MPMEVQVTFNKFMGISLALCSALFTSLVAFCIRKLQKKHIHYSIIIVYASYFGIPISFLISLVIILTDRTRKTSMDRFMIERTALLWQIFYLFGGSMGGICAQLALNMALKYEQASRITIILSSGLVFIFVLQYIFLGIQSNLLSIIGAVLIVSSTSMIILRKALEGDNT